MSPSWRNRLQISIGTDRISLFRMKGFRPQLLERREVSFDPTALAPPWQALSGALAKLLAGQEWQGSEADIVLSNKVVRHAVVPFNGQLKKYTEKEAFVRHVLKGTYGPVAGHWELRIRDQGASAPLIVGTADRALLESLRQTLSAHALSLRSVTSRLMVAYSRHRRSVRADPSWLVVHESGHSQFALLSAGKIVSVHGANHQSLDDLPLLLDRENLTAPLGEPCRTAYLDLPEDTALPPFPESRYEIVRLDPSQPQGIVSRGSQLLARAMRGAQRMELDFLKPAQRPNRNAGGMLLVTGLALLIEMGVSYHRLHNELAAMDQEIAASKLRLDESALDRRAQFTEKDFDAARQIVNRLATPWESFFSGLESVSNKHVAILSLVPEMQTGMLRVTGEAKNYPALLTLVAQLRATKPFFDVYLSSQQTRQDDPQHPVEFIIYMHWVKPS